MAKINKKPIKQSDPNYQNARAAKRENDQRFAIRVTQAKAATKIYRLERADKRRRYSNDMDLLDKVSDGYQGELRYDFLGNKKLIAGQNGELIRERGVWRKNRKIQARDADGKVYIRRVEKESRRKNESLDYDVDGNLIAKSKEYKDGRFEEKMELDENGKLIRTNYYTRRFRDVGFGTAISEEMSDPFQRAGKTYRRLTRKHGSKTKIYERDKDGNLDLIGREKRGFSKYTTKSKDGKTAKTDIKHSGGFSKSYQSRLDTEGNEISRDITSVRRLWNKRSASYDDKTGEMVAAKHTFGKLYKSETKYDGSHKYTTKKFLGLRLSSKLQPISNEELNADILRADEVAQHNAAWKDVAVVHQPPAPGTVKQLGNSIRAPVVAQSTLAPSSAQVSANATGVSTSTLEEDDEESNFLKSSRPSSQGKTAQTHTSMPAVAKVSALLAGFAPIGGNKSTNARALSGLDSLASSRRSSVSSQSDIMTTSTTDAPSTAVTSRQNSSESFSAYSSASNADKGKSADPQLRDSHNMWAPTTKAETQATTRRVFNRPPRGTPSLAEW